VNQDSVGLMRWDQLGNMTCIAREMTPALCNTVIYQQDSRFHGVPHNSQQQSNVFGKHERHGEQTGPWKGQTFLVNLLLETKEQ